MLDCTTGTLIALKIAGLGIVSTPLLVGMITVTILVKIIATMKN